MGRIYLLRHGQTAWNKEEVFRGTLDVPLDDVGRRQARDAGRALKRKGLKDPVIYCSPQARARETAEIVAAEIPVQELHPEPAFRDLNFGEWQGMPKTEVARLYPDLLKKWATEPTGIVFPGGEGLEAVADRAEEALYRLARENLHRDMILVSHQVVNKAILCRLLGAGLNVFWRLGQDTACLNLLEYNGSYFVVQTVNDTHHLSAAL